MPRAIKLKTSARFQIRGIHAGRDRLLGEYEHVHDEFGAVTWSDNLCLQPEAQCAMIFPSGLYPMKVALEKHMN